MEKKIINNKEYYSHIFDVDVKIFKSEKSKEILASLSKLAGFLSKDIDFEANIDLVPIAFDAFVVNRRNKNNQVIGANKAIEIVNNFKYKFINIEHNREDIIGVILGTGFSSFGEDSKPLSLEDVKDTDEPFNVVAHGVIWKIVNQDLVESIEDSSNILSKNYKKISASWELLSSDFEIAVFDKNEKNLINASIDKTNKYKKYLYTEGGNGVSDDGKIICNLISGDTLPVGVGLTTNPAAEVEGVLTANSEMNVDLLDGYAANSIYLNVDVSQFHKIGESLKAFIEEKFNFLAESNKKNNNLENNSVYTIKDNNIMRLDNIDQLTDENIKEVKASNIHELHDKIKSELQSVSEKYASDKKNLEDESKNNKQAMEAALKESKDWKEQLSSLQNKIAQLEASEAQRLADELYNSRMELIESKYQINDASRKVIANRLQKISNDKEFEQYEEELAAFLSVKNQAQTEETSASEVIASAFDSAEVTNETVNAPQANDNKRAAWEKAAKGIKIVNIRK